MRRDRLVCIYVVFLVPQSQFRKSWGLLEESEQPLEFLDCIFYKSNDQVVSFL